jgi:hypothetical protein
VSRFGIEPVRRRFGRTKFEDRPNNHPRLFESAGKGTVLSIDDRFRDTGSTRPGSDLTGKAWPHGFLGKPVPHGTRFSR